MLLCFGITTLSSIAPFGVWLKRLLPKICYDPWNFKSMGSSVQGNTVLAFLVNISLIWVSFNGILHWEPYAGSVFLPWCVSGWVYAGQKKNQTNTESCKHNTLTENIQCLHTYWDITNLDAVTLHDNTSISNLRDGLPTRPIGHVRKDPGHYGALDEHRFNLILFDWLAFRVGNVL